MKISPINNQTQYKSNIKPQFRARFTQAQLAQMFETSYRSGFDKNMCESVPKLYTLLERLEKIMPGEKAIFKTFTNSSGETKDIIEIGKKTFYTEPYSVNHSEVEILENALVDGFKDKSAQYIDRAYMPKSVYEQKWWNNLEKTEDDILKDFSFKEA